MKRRAEAHAHYANAVVLELQHRRSASLTEFRKAAELLPEDEELVWDVSRKFVAAGQPDIATELLRQAADRPGASALTWARLSAAELQAGEPERALAAAQQAVELDPAMLQGYQGLFLARLQAGQLKEAKAVLDLAAPYGAGNPEFLIQLSELYGVVGAHNPAERESIESTRANLLDQAATCSIDQDMLRVRLADGYASLGRNDRAAELYQEALETMPDSPRIRDIVRSKLTEAYLRGRDPSRARGQLERLLKADPTNVRVCYLLGSLAYQMGDLPAARDYFERVIVLRPEFEQAYYDLAAALINLDLNDEAEKVLEKARHKFPQSFAMEMLSGLVHMRREEPVAAMKHFTSAEIMAQATDPERLTEFFYFQYGAASEQAGEYAAAERHLRKSLELDPDFAPAQNYLGYMWTDRGEHLEEARALIEKAVQTDPQNAAYLDSLGWVLFKLNRPQEALAEILKAIDHLDEPDPVVYEHLGDIHAQLGDTRQAAEAWRKAYELEPTEKLREKIESAGQAVPPGSGEE